MEETLCFAREELNKYWRKVTGETDCAVRLGLYAEEEAGTADSYRIEVREGRGHILASNGRSVLLGVYAFFRALGCRFLYPTEEGEELPPRCAEDCTVQLREEASFRHRGVTIEGCAGNQNVLDMIDWMPKVGFNSYFIQFFSANIIYRKWYDHWWNPFLEKKTFTREESVGFTREAVAALKKRGMIHHAVGHGWTCEPLGIPADGWDEFEDDVIPAALREKLALVNGERKFFHHMPLTTNLCYADKDARRMIVDCVLAYLDEHTPDILHVWLADDCDNFCTCEQCSKTTPSDQYVELLNEIDAALTARRNTTRIVFLMYNELMYPPRRAKIVNPDRFILMFAPSGRNYDECLTADAVCRAPTPTPGKFRQPVGVGENIALLRAWKEYFSGDSFIFDYPLMHSICKEFGGIRLAKVIEKDINALRKLELNGYLSCQLQRVSFPTGFPMYVLGRKLWDKKLSYESLKKEYFFAAYGEYAECVYRTLEKISSWLPYEYMHRKLSEKGEEIVSRAKREKKAAAAAEKRIAALQKNAGGNVKKRLDILLFCLGYVRKILKLIEIKAAGAPQAQVDALRRGIQEFLFTHEPDVQPFMDVGQYYCNLMMMAEAKWGT